MQALLYSNLSTATLSETLRGGNYTFPTLTQGDQVRLQLRLAEKLEGENVEVSRTVSAFRAGIGKVDAQPDAGSITLAIDASDMAALDYGFTAAEFLSAAQAVEATISAVEEKTGSFIVTCPTQLEFTVSDNCLDPISFMRFRYWQCSDSGDYKHEIRFQQTAIAFTSTWARVVPLPPSILAVQDGATVDEFLVNEVQHLKVPPNFRGTYVIERDDTGEHTTHLSRENNITEIKAALDEIADPDGEFLVSIAYDGTARIEFAGEMAGTAYDLMTIRVIDAPEGDITFTLDLDTSELAALFRDVDEIKLPLEIEAVLEDENDDEVLHTVTLYRGEVTVQEQVVREEDAEAQDIDWLTPPRPVDYIPYENDQVITGSQHYIFALTAATTAVAHSLGTAAVHITVVDRATGEIIPPDDYTATIDSDDQITFSAFATAPTGGTPYDGAITTAGPVSAFQSHTHTIAQITGLQATLDTIGSRLTALEALVPSLSSGITTDPDYTETWTLPDFFEVFPILGSASPDAPGTGLIADLARSDLPTLAPALFPAIHASSATALTTTTSGDDLVPADPEAADAETLFQNQTGEDVIISLSSPIITAEDAFGYTFTLPDDGYLAHNGVDWYPLAQYGDTAEKSYYARNLERTLFQDVISSDQLTAARTYALTFTLDVGAIAANTPWHWYLVIEVAALTSDSTPATTGGNLAEDDWDDAPVLEQKIVLMTSPRNYKFGYTVIRDSAGDLTATALKFGKTVTADPPASAEFGIRVRLVRADTVNSVAAPRGFLGVSAFSASATITD